MDIKAAGINHSKLEAGVMQSPTKGRRASVINFPSDSTVLTQREPEVICPSRVGSSSLYQRWLLITLTIFYIKGVQTT